MRWWKLIRKAPKLIARIALNLDEAETAVRLLPAAIKDDPAVQRVLVPLNKIKTDGRKLRDLM